MFIVFIVSFSSGLGDGMRFPCRDPATDLPRPFLAQLGDAGRAGPASRPHHCYASSAARTFA